MINMKTHLLAVFIPIALLAACSSKEVPSAPAPAVPPPVTAVAAPAVPTTGTATVTLESRSGSTARGELKLSASGGAVLLDGVITGLSPGVEHGIHLHETGDCSAPDAKSAGDHFNPTGAPHGAPASVDRHLGDIPNINADTSGRATLAASIMGATLRDGGPTDLMGKALVVHAQRDDYKTQPSGDSGARIACGVVR
jgi:superoxide dismutase, Cu-Zn family